MMLTLIPRASSRQPMEAAARPLPSEDTTPPVTKMYFADMSATSFDGLEICAGWARLSIAGSAVGSNGVDFWAVGQLVVVTLKETFAGITVRTARKIGILTETVS